MRAAPMICSLQMVMLAGIGWAGACLLFYNIWISKGLLTHAFHLHSHTHPVTWVIDSNVIRYGHLGKFPRHAQNDFTPLRGMSNSSIPSHVPSNTASTTQRGRKTAQHLQWKMYKQKLGLLALKELNEQLSLTEKQGLEPQEQNKKPNFQLSQLKQYFHHSSDVEALRLFAKQYDNHTITAHDFVMKGLTIFSNNRHKHGASINDMAATLSQLFASHPDKRRRFELHDSLRDVLKEADENALVPYYSIPLARAEYYNASKALGGTPAVNRAFLIDEIRKLRIYTPKIQRSRKILRSLSDKKLAKVWFLTMQNAGWNVSLPFYLDVLQQLREDANSTLIHHSKDRVMHMTDIEVKAVVANETKQPHSHFGAPNRMDTSCRHHHDSRDRASYTDIRESHASALDVNFENVLTLPFKSVLEEMKNSVEGVEISLFFDFEEFAVYTQQILRFLFLLYPQNKTQLLFDAIEERLRNEFNRFHLAATEARSQPKQSTKGVGRREAYLEDAVLPFEALHTVFNDPAADALEALFSHPQIQKMQSNDSSTIANRAAHPLLLNTDDNVELANELWAKTQRIWNFLYMYALHNYTFENIHPSKPFVQSFFTADISFCLPHPLRFQILKSFLRQVFSVSENRLQFPQALEYMHRFDLKAFPFRYICNFAHTRNHLILLHQHLQQRIPNVYASVMNRMLKHSSPMTQHKHPLDPMQAAAFSDSVDFILCLDTRDCFASATSLVCAAYTLLSLPKLPLLGFPLKLCYYNAVMQSPITYSGSISYLDGLTVSDLRNMLLNVFNEYRVLSDLNVSDSEVTPYFSKMAEVQYDEPTSTALSAEKIQIDEALLRSLNRDELLDILPSLRVTLPEYAYASLTDLPTVVLSDLCCLAFARMEGFVFEAQSSEVKALLSANATNDSLKRGRSFIESILLAEMKEGLSFFNEYTEEQIRGLDDAKLLEFYNGFLSFLKATDITLTAAKSEQFQPLKSFSKGPPLSDSTPHNTDVYNLETEGVRDDHCSGERTINTLKTLLPAAASSQTDELYSSDSMKASARCKRPVNKEEGKRDGLLEACVNYPIKRTDTRFNVLNESKPKEEESQLSMIQKNMFSSLNVSTVLLNAIADMFGIFVTPTHVQTEVIPPILARKNILFGSQAGSGKTLAFLIPVLQILKLEETIGSIVRRSRHPRALVLAPSRELVLQTSKVAKHLGHFVKIASTVAVGGGQYVQQKESVYEKVDILMGTPSRILLHWKRGNIALADVSIVVVDEVDTMLLQGFYEDVLRIVNITQRTFIGNKKKAQLIFTTATVTKDVKALIRAPHFPPIHTVELPGLHTLGKSIRHKIVDVQNIDKMQVLKTVLASRKKSESIIIFCNTIQSCRACEHFVRELSQNSTSYHGSIPQRTRDKNLKDFRDNQVPILVTTDLASRGLDIPHVDTVILFDFPLNSIDYLHRAGRTGRMGRNGTVISLITKRDRVLASAIEEATRKGLPLDSLSSDKDEYTRNGRLHYLMGSARNQRCLQRLTNLDQNKTRFPKNMQSSRMQENSWRKQC